MTHHSEQGQGDRTVPPTRGLPAAFRLGWLVFAALIVLVVLEYIVFLVLTRNMPLMIVMNVIDAALIMYYFMHVSRLRRRGETEEGA